MDYSKLTSKELTSIALNKRINKEVTDKACMVLFLKNTFKNDEVHIKHAPKLKLPFGMWEFKYIVKVFRSCEIKQEFFLFVKTLHPNSEINLMPKSESILHIEITVYADDNI